MVGHRLQLGPEIGRGAMGTVFQGVLDGLPVAVKILTGKGGVEPAYRRAFRTELRAMATLAHPHVVQVYDFGLSPSAWSQVPEGSPYIVMEMAPESLLNHGGKGWTQLRHLLDAILRGLAHAHARGIIHRDLKPANVLLQNGVPKIADFGLARAFESVVEGVHERPAGTPGYMPPEQRLGKWRDVGPWTDLYAVGRLALDLAGAEGVEVPVHFAGWVSRLRQEDRHARYQRAADARRDLWELDGPRTQLGEALVGVGLEVDTEAAFTQPYFDGEDGVAGALPEPLPVREVRIPDEPMAEPDVPLPRNAGLLMLRSPMVVQRDAQRAALWAEARVVARGAARFVVLQGPPGGGKRELAMWMCHQLHETGAGCIELATHHRLGGPRTGLQGMLARELRCLDLDPQAATVRCLDWLRARDPAMGLSDALAYVDLMAPALAPGPLSQLPEESIQFERVRQFIRLDAAGRVPLVWLDSLQWADSTLRFVEYCLNAGDPMLLLGTMEGHRQDSWLAGLGARVLEVRPRPTEAVRERLATCLGLPLGETLEQLVMLCGDNLLYARMVLDDWLADGVVDRDGVGLKPLPDTDLRRTWGRRLDAVVEARGAEVLPVIAAAAVLGEEVAASRHRDVCRWEHLPFDETLVDDLMARGLALPLGLNASDWRFASPALCQLVLERATPWLPALHSSAALSYRLDPSTRLRRQWHLGRGE